MNGTILTELKSLKATRIYFDANIFIYALEGISPFAEALLDVFESVDKGEMTAVTSELSLAECLVKPLTEKNATQRTIFEQSLTTSDTFKVVPVHREILKMAASLRATHTTIRLPDAIHVATALSERCTAFLTNDSRIKVSISLHFLLLKDFIHA